MPPRPPPRKKVARRPRARARPARPVRRPQLPRLQRQRPQTRVQTPPAQQAIPATVQRTAADLGVFRRARLGFHDWRGYRADMSLAKMDERVAKIDKEIAVARTAWTKKLLEREKLGIIAQKTVLEKRKTKHQTQKTHLMQRYKVQP